MIVFVMIGLTESLHLDVEVFRIKKLTLGQKYKFSWCIDGPKTTIVDSTSYTNYQDSLWVTLFLVHCFSFDTS